MSAKQRSDAKDATVTCRAPRAVISFDGSIHWESRAAVVIAAMGKYWGGSQFILIPHDDEKVDPALLRAAAAFDPDDILEYNFSEEEMARCAGEYVEPVNADHESGVYRPRRAYTFRPPVALLEATSIYHTEIVENRSPSGSIFMSANDMGRYIALADMPGGHDHGVYQAVPKECGGSIGLAMAVKCGFVEAPTLPFFMQPGFELPYEDFRFALGGNDPTRLILTSTGGLSIGNPIPATLKASWTRTEVGLGSIYFVSNELRPSIVVVGSTVEDFCLAYALERMTGLVLWLPGDLLADESNDEKLEFSIFEFLNSAYQRNADTLVTSITWPAPDLSDRRAAIQTHLRS